VVLGGHEHNYQHAHVDGIDYFITGGAGKVRTGQPGSFDQAHTVAWAASHHFLLVRLQGMRASVIPIGEDGRPLSLSSPEGTTVPATTLIELGS
jgi:hypothetical protein